MKHRYTILGIRSGEEHESEIAHCNSNPEAILAAAEQQIVALTAAPEHGGKRYTDKKWRGLRIRENVQA